MGLLERLSHLTKPGGMLILVGKEPPEERSRFFSGPQGWILRSRKTPVSYSRKKNGWGETSLFGSTNTQILKLHFAWKPKVFFCPKEAEESLLVGF